MLTQAEYNKIIDDIVAVEQERLLESLNAIFEKEGHTQDAFIHTIVQFVKDQPATTARIVSAILEKTGSLSVDS